MIVTLKTSVAYKIQLAQLYSPAFLKTVIRVPALNMLFALLFRTLLDRKNVGKGT